MIVINKQSSRSGLVVGESAKSYRIRVISNKATWMPKQYAVVDFDFYQAQLAMHLIAGYGIEDNSFDAIAKLSAFVPALILADRKLDAQIYAGRDDWGRVFVYDVAQAGGAWLAANPKATVADFTAKLEELIV